MSRHGDALPIQTEPTFNRRMYFIYGLLSLAAALDGGSASANSSDLPLLLVSFDGFRSDYLRRFSMPNLEQLYGQGVLVEEMTNVFVTKTFPNHYSLVTGLYAESHGILASSMYDAARQQSFSPANGSAPFWWEQAEPLWNTAQDRGYTTAAAMWPGSDVRIHNRTATHFLPYDATMGYRERLQQVVRWMQGNATHKGVMFSVLYWEEPDHSGHMFGPDNSSAMAHVLKEVDDNIGLLVSELKGAELWGRVNLVITSDHGMAQCSAQRLISLDACLHPDNYTLVDLTPVCALIPRADPQVLMSLLTSCHANMKAYLKQDLPERLHYRGNQRVTPILLVADEGWTIVRRSGDPLPRLGDHGYDNALPSMHPFLVGVGPAFRRGYRGDGLRSVDVYPLMCHLLSVTPRPHNGSLERASCLLADHSRSQAGPVAALVAGGLLLLIALTCIVKVVRNGQTSASRPFQRLRLDEEDDEPLLD